MSTLFVDDINEKTSGHGVTIPGHVLQVAGNSINTALTVSGTSFTDTGLTATITPASTSSKVLVIVNLGIVSTGVNDAVLFRILRGSTEVGSGSGASTKNVLLQCWQNANNLFFSYSNSYFDSPATDSSVTYKLQFAMTNTTDTGYVNRRASDNYGRTSSNFTIMEIAQ